LLFLLAVSLSLSLEHVFGLYLGELSSPFF